MKNAKCCMLYVVCCLMQVVLLFFDIPDWNFKR